MEHTQETEFNPNPPLSISNKKYIILRNKENKSVFMTSGGEYRNDLYDLVKESDDFDELRDVYMKLVYDK